MTRGRHANHEAPDLGCKRLTCLIFYPVISVKNLTFGKNHYAFHQKRSVILSQSTKLPLTIFMLDFI